MMKRAPRHIHALMTSWLTGEITQEEALYLKRLIAEDPAIKAAWMEFKQQFSQEDIQHKFERYEQLPWIPAEEITGGTPRRRRMYKIIRGAGLAAAVITGISVGIYIWRSRTAEPIQPVAKVSNTQPGPKEDIALQLANGQTINLSRAKNSILLGNTRLNNAGKALSYTLADGNKDSIAASAINSLTVPIGKDYKISLSDGTEVWLNSATTLKFPFRFTGKLREITIKGEAYVKVAQRAGQPFLVHSQHGTVQVLGTSFNINDYDSGVVKIALVEGAVRFKTGTKDVAIKPGQEAVYTAGKGIRLQSFEEDDVLAWRAGKYYFSDATLKEIVTVFPRWYGINVVIDNPALGRERFAGMMDRNKPVTVFLDNLVKTMKLSYYFDKEDNLHLQ